MTNDENKRIAWVLRKFVDDVASNDNATPEEEQLVERLDNIPRIKRIQSGDIPVLKTAFDNASTSIDKDPYLVSPTYHALTGRRGLWLYSDEETSTAVVFCLHPNLKNTVVIYPGFGEGPNRAIVNLIDKIQAAEDPGESLNIKGIKFQIGRVRPESSLHDIAEGRHLIHAETVEEQVLDWRFPVHTVKCRDLVERKGKDYGRIRQAMNKFERAGAEVREIDFKSRDDQKTISKISRAWEDKTAHYDRYDLTLVPYFNTLVKMAQTQAELGLRGLFVVLNGKPRGFSIWEPGHNSTKAANLFASQIGRENADTDAKNNADEVSITNLGTFLHVKIAEQLLEDGTDYVCLGGSENETMDDYKRGFRPKYSTPLQTVAIELFPAINEEGTAEEEGPRLRDTGTNGSSAPEKEADSAGLRHPIFPFKRQARSQQRAPHHKGIDSEMPRLD